MLMVIVIARYRWSFARCSAASPLVLLASAGEFGEVALVLLGCLPAGRGGFLELGLTVGLRLLTVGPREATFLGRLGELPLRVREVLA
jgi:hypothetical protein